MSKTDSQLWEEILGGRSSAWKELISRYQALVYAVATRAGLSSLDAADCFQQTWVSLYTSRAQLKDPTRLSAWLVTSAKREAIRLSKRSGRESAPGEKFFPDLVDNSPLPDQSLEILERQSHLEIGLRALDSRCRKLLTAIFFAPIELSYQEIAQQLNMTPNSMGPVRGRCLQKLKKNLVESGYLDVRTDSSRPL